MTEKGDWERSVLLELRGIGQFREIKNTIDAVDCLMDGWPGEEDDHYTAAIKICLSAIEGNLSARTARDAFIRAARRARIYIKPDSLDDLREHAFHCLPRRH
ncbi:DUF982 domain-containing protein [Rhizobium calliandrae]|uniref:DUF982 domain-containing protein n=1 Tax=Rhizobium calliandrae TaxID=1312182 RepID=A0ABT7KC92_9HYPH|nr:DUF982 domain-containing protein [Rhizobium calliandrae]MDL2406243.1 DUF982 domain-containing protein [Rhizobium calliandrae]